MDSATAKAYSPLVKKIAFGVFVKCPPSVELDDLIQEGMIGLMGAYDRFDDTQGACFATFATHSIRGAMLDMFRRSDTLSRGDRHKWNRIEQTRAILAHKNGYSPSEGDLASELGMSIERFEQWASDVRSIQTVQLEDMGDVDFDYLDTVPSPTKTPEEALQYTQELAAIEAALLTLPERELSILKMTYLDEMFSTDIAKIYGIADSRVSQIRAATLKKLNSRLWALRG